MKTILRALAAGAALALLCAPPARGQAPAPEAADSAKARGRPELYLRAVTGTGALARSVGLGTFDHLRTDPDEWGGGVDALGTRIAARWGTLVVEETVEHAAAAALGRVPDPAYVPCPCTGGPRRLAYALLAPVTDHGPGEGAFAVPRVAGVYAGAFSRLVIYPDAELDDVLLAGSLSLLFEGAFNAFREFTGWDL